jgi:hypothetical protein
VEDVRIGIAVLGHMCNTLYSPGLQGLIPHEIRPPNAGNPTVLRKLPRKEKGTSPESTPPGQRESQNKIGSRRQE